jgi:hypothetical protein
MGFAFSKEEIVPGKLVRSGSARRMCAYKWWLGDGNRITNRSVTCIRFVLFFGVSAGTSCGVAQTDTPRRASKNHSIRGRGNTGVGCSPELRMSSVVSAGCRTGRFVGDAPLPSPATFPLSCRSLQRLVSSLYWSRKR